MRTIGSIPWRITLPVLAALLAFAAFGGVQVFQHIQEQRKAEWHRSEARRALEASEHHLAEHHLSHRRELAGPDAGVDWRHAQTLLAMPDPHDTYRPRAIRLLGEVIEQQPGHAEAWAALLEALHEAGRHAAAIALARRRLELIPEEGSTWVWLARAHAARGEVEAARDSVIRALQHEPDAWRARLLRAELAREPADWMPMSPAEPVHALKRGVIQARLGEPERAETWLERAAEYPPPDAAFARELVRRLDEVGAYEASLAYLEAQGRPDRPWLFGERVRRRIEAEAWEAAASASRQAAWRDAGTDPSWLGLHGWALIRQGRSEEVAPLVSALRARPLDRYAEAWARWLVAAAEAGEAGADGWFSPTASSVGALQEAMSVLGPEPVMLGELAWIFEAAGEAELAEHLWRWLASRRPGWSTPPARLARFASERGEGERAHELASRAAALGGDDFELRALRVRWRWREALAGEDDQALEEVWSSLSAWEASASRPGLVRALRVELRLSSGYRNLGRALGRQWLEDRVGQGESSGWIALAEALSEAAPELAERAAAQASAETPALALRLARWRWDRGEPVPAGWFDPPAEGDAWRWRLAAARFAEGVGELEEAEGHWRALLGERPSDVALLNEALSGSAVWRDRELAGEAIARLHGGVGQTGLNWRVYRARWRLEADPPEAEGAALLLENVLEYAPGRVDVRRDLARARAEQGRYRLAIQELQRALAYAPADEGLLRDLARLHRQAGQPRQAREALEQAARVR